MGAASQRRLSDEPNPDAAATYQSCRRCVGGGAGRSADVTPGRSVWSASAGSWRVVRSRLIPYLCVTTSADPRTAAGPRIRAGSNLHELSSHQYGDAARRGLSRGYCQRVSKLETEYRWAG